MSWAGEAAKAARESAAEFVAEKRQAQRDRRTPGTSQHTLGKLVAGGRAVDKLSRQAQRRRG